MRGVIGGRWGTTEFDKIGLVFLIARGNEAVDLGAVFRHRLEVKSGWPAYLALQLHLLLVGVWRVPLCKTSLALPILNQDEGENHLEFTALTRLEKSGL